ncbi:MAG: HpcH/HpaI aldolase/citrate lyase family protein [Candidatus Cohnella colombiensis]|uniref:HpcH/HpaI aldolase/citrate lyase family protein n=1 Tax=Candidatus Cohnella colombiensis TaxID=3121368 RepID=A0AA95EYD6_9BACL|nr:MAG: HpcH/HpaI aldolase/citrate lyase family protein [Cohnella sp.]
MRYFNYLSGEQSDQVFYRAPMPFDNTSDHRTLAYAIGAALYCPATKLTIAEDIITHRHEGLTTLVLDLEDAIGDQQVDTAEHVLKKQLEQLSVALEQGRLSKEDLPLLFIRVRSPEQLVRIMDRLDEQLLLLTGFVFPKFSPYNGPLYFEVLASYNRKKSAIQPKLYGLPILETDKVIFKETRVDTLLGIRAILDQNEPYVLNVRIGATDFSSMFGLRRSPDMTIYDIAPIRDCIADIINVFGRMQDSYVISGPVWEYFSNRERVLKPQLRQTLFEQSLGRDGRRLRMNYITNYVDGLIREVMLDKENGIVGKTIIHPSHIKPVQSLLAVSHEEFVDASSIMASNDGQLGVMKSQYANKMNEIKPHLNWAKRIISRANIYGVLNEQQHFISLLPEHEHAYV